MSFHFTQFTVSRFTNRLWKVGIAVVDRGAGGQRRDAEKRLRLRVVFIFLMIQVERYRPRVVCGLLGFFVQAR